jgi:Tfp pilus assembly ATPase PilU
MKTAMQELMDYLNEDEFSGICEIRDKVEELYEKEKQQIIKAHNIAVSSPYTDLWIYPIQGEIITKGEKYYNENYNNENNI